MYNVGMKDGVAEPVLEQSAQPTIRCVRAGAAFSRPAVPQSPMRLPPMTARTELGALRYRVTVSLLYVGGLAQWRAASGS